MMSTSLVVTVVYLSRVVVSVSGVVAVDSDKDQYKFPGVGDYPYVVALLSALGGCTGVIVSKDFVLTAAHCVFRNDAPIGDNGVQVMAGVKNYIYNNGPNNTKQATGNTRIFLHPNFQYGVPSKFDVALVRVREAFSFNKYVANISVAGTGWPQKSNGGGSLDLGCVTLGYGGYYSRDRETANLKQRNVVARHGEHSCPCSFRFQHKRMVCEKVTDANKRHPLMCKGDDGGPLICNKEVVAIAHMVWSTEQCTEFMYPTKQCLDNPSPGYTSYSYLCPLNDWLHSIVPAIPRTPVSCDACEPGYSLGLFFILGIVCWTHF